MRWIGWFVGALWRFSRRTWVGIHPDLRPRSPASGLYLFLFLLFFIIGLVLVLFGVDLGRLDLWLEAQGGWLDTVFSALFRVVCGLVLALCVFMVLGGLWQKLFSPRSHMGEAADFEVETDSEGEAAEESKPVGLGCMIAAVIVGYFAWFGVIG